MLGTQRWACPACSAKIRFQRSLELQRAYKTITRKPDRFDPGLFMTLTLRHNVDIPLANLLATLQQAYATMRRSRRWRDLMNRIGHVGIIRSTEITYSQKTGWHPHLHCWLVSARRVTNAELAAAEAEITEMWVKAVDDISCGKAMVPNHDRGCDLRRVTSKGFVAYIAKNQDDKAPGNSRTLAQEMTRLDLKTGRSKTSMTPFEMLDSGEEMAALWCEYVEATHGHRAIAWSRGLKRLLGVTDAADAAQTVGE